MVIIDAIIFKFLDVIFSDFRWWKYPSWISFTIRIICRRGKESCGEAKNFISSTSYQMSPTNAEVQANRGEKGAIQKETKLEEYNILNE